MDSPLPENRSNLLVYVAAAAGVFALILGIVALMQISKVKRQVGTADIAKLESDVASAVTSASTAARDASTANSQNNPAIRALTTTMQREIGNELTSIRSEIQRVEELTRQAPNRSPAVAAGGNGGGSAGGGGGGGAATATPGQLDAEGMYVIKSGDLLGKIAQQFGVSLAELLAANPGVDPRRLQVGQKIVIPQQR